MIDANLLLFACIESGAIDVDLAHSGARLKTRNRLPPSIFDHN